MPLRRVLCSPGWSLPHPLLVVVNPRLPGQTLGRPPGSFRSKAALTLGAEVKHVRPGHTLKGPCCHLGSGLAEPSHSISHGAEIHHTRGLGENQKAGPGT